jgi:hypothetical protein
MLVVSTLDKPDTRPDVEDTLEVGSGPMEIRLQHDTDVPMSVCLDALEDLQGLVDEGGPFHIDTDESTVAHGGDHDRFEVPYAIGGFNLQANLGQLD